MSQKQSQCLRVASCIQ